MYAVIETGGKQYRVEVGTELEVELLDAEPGQSITLDRVLLVADGDEAAIGRPVVANATVDAEVLRRDRGEKLISFKYRPKARRRVKKGHRQELTVLRITDVRLDGKSAAESARKADEAAKTERQRLEEAAARQAAEDAALAARLAVKPAAEQAPAETEATAETETAAESATPKRRSRAKAPAAETAAETASESTEAAEAVAGEEATPDAGASVDTDADGPEAERAEKSE